MRVVKWIAGLFFGLILLLGVGVGIIAATFDPNDYKSLAIEQAQKQGWTLAIDGDLSLSFWPRIAVDMPPTTLSAIEAKQSVQFDNAQVSLAVMPLLTEQRAEVSTLILDRPVIRWDLAAPSASTSTAPSESTSAGEPLLAVAIGGVQINDADIQLFNGAELVHEIQVPTLQLGALEPNAWVALSTQATYQAPGIPATPMALNAELRTPSDFSKLDIKGLTLNTLGISATGDLNIVPEPMAISGQLRASEFDARQVAAHFGVELSTQNPEALSAISLDMNLGQGGPVYAQSLNLMLDGQSWVGEAGLRSLTPLDFNLVLNGERLKLDDYLAPAGDQTAVAGSTQTDAISPLAGLAGINGDVRITLAELETQGLSFETIEASAEIRDRRIHFTQLAANAYQGQLLGNAVLNGRTAVPSMSADLELSSLQIQGLLDDLAGFEDLSGTAMVQANLTAEGLAPDQLMASLNGNVNGELVNGAFKGIAVDSLVCDGIATLAGGQSKLAASADTPFDAVRFNADIQQGLASIDTLKLGLVNLAVAGTGQINLPAEQLDLALDASLTGDKQITGCSIPSFVQNAKLPLRCQGGFADDPTSLCGLDSRRMDGLVSQQAKAKLEAKKDELKAKTQAKVEAKKAELKDEIKAKAADKLKGLFR